jgi:cobalt transporter subunit CbtB
LLRSFCIASTAEGQHMSSNALTASSSVTLPLSQRLVLAVGGCLLGAALIFVAGFSPIEALHNAAHDTRHSAAFPCH